MPTFVQADLVGALGLAFRTLNPAVYAEVVVYSTLSSVARMLNRKRTEVCMSTQAHMLA